MQQRSTLMRPRQHEIVWCKPLASWSINCNRPLSIRFHSLQAQLEPTQSLVAVLRPKDAVVVDPFLLALTTAFPGYKHSPGALHDPRVFKDPIGWALWSAREDGPQARDLLTAHTLPGPISELMLRFWRGAWADEDKESKTFIDLQDLFIQICLTVISFTLNDLGQLVLVQTPSIKRARSIIIDLDANLIRGVKGNQAAKNFKVHRTVLNAENFCRRCSGSVEEGEQQALDR
jgi:hypothetical protein